MCLCVCVCVLRWLSVCRSLTFVCLSVCSSACLTVATNPPLLIALLDVILETMSELPLSHLSIYEKLASSHLPFALFVLTQAPGAQTSSSSPHTPSHWGPRWATLMMTLLLNAGATPFEDGTPPPQVFPSRCRSFCKGMVRWVGFCCCVRGGETVPCLGCWGYVCVSMATVLTQELFV